jgi:hypothetical protein
VLEASVVSRSPTNSWPRGQPQTLASPHFLVDPHLLPSREELVESIANQQGNTGWCRPLGLRLEFLPLASTGALGVRQREQPPFFAPGMLIPHVVDKGGGCATALQGADSQSALAQTFR